MASPKLVVADKPNRSEHSTERADLRGQRLLIGEELSEGRSIDITALKRIQDVSVIKARYVHKDNISFHASHSLFVTTNYVPVINETDHGTWRRLALLRFRYTFRKRPEQVLRPADRLGDPGLKRRIKQDDSSQHDAIVTWAVEGARAWYADPAGTLEPTAGIESDTLDWRTTADRVLGFWRARLEPDPDACILADEMLDAFNAWLAEGGHAAWSRETFAPRFAQHHETTLHGVESRRTAALSGVSRWAGRDGWQAQKPLPGKATVWMRVRFRTADDQEKSTQVTEVPESQANVPVTTTCETFVQDSGTSVTKINNYTERPVNHGHSGAIAPGKPDPQNTTESNDRALFDVGLPQAGSRIPLPALVSRDGAAEPAPLDDITVLTACVIEETRSLTVDVETTGYPIGHPDYALRTVQLGHDRHAAVLDPADPPQADAIRDLLAAAPVLHAHSATADLIPLIHAGLCDETAWDRMHDTALIAKLTSPAADPAAGLKQLSAAILGDQAVSPAADRARAELFKAGKWLTDVSETTPRERSGWAQADPACQTMVRYAASDVLDTAALAAALPAVTAAVLGRERAIQRACARVTLRGLRIDRDRVRHLTIQHTAARNSAAELVRVHGIANPGSSQQVAAALGKLGATLPSTPTGKPSAAEDALTPLCGTAGPAGDLARAVLDYRDHDTVLGTFLHPYERLAAAGDGRVRPTVYTLGTDTGRMTCVRPNLQQVPREGGIRACITADPGEVLISADFAAVELRVAAALSGDGSLIRMITEGTDLHWAVARQVWGPDAAKADRYTAKRIVFGRIYGGGVPALARQTGASERLVQAAVDTLDALTPALTAWSRQVRDHVKAGRAQFPAYSGRIIHLPADVPYKAPNYCIQGTARELLADALLRWQDTPWGNATVLPVHDEIIAAVPEADAAAATKALAECMTSELNGVPIVAEASTPSFAWQDSA